MLVNRTHYAVVLGLREDADEGHHALHLGAPSGEQASVRRGRNHGVHVHHAAFHEGVLREVGDAVGVGGDLGGIHLHVVHLHALHDGHCLAHLVFGERAVGGGHVGVGSDAHAAAKRGAVVVAHRDDWGALQHPHAGVHVDTSRHSIRTCHAADGGGHLVHVVVRE